MSLGRTSVSPCSPVAYGCPLMTSLACSSGLHVHDRGHAPSHHRDVGSPSDNDGLQRSLSSGSAHPCPPSCGVGHLRSPSLDVGHLRSPSCDTCHPCSPSCRGSVPPRLLHGQEPCTWMSEKYHSHPSSSDLCSRPPNAPRLPGRSVASLCQGQSSSVRA